MGAVPAAIETDTQPPTTIPLGHFLVAVSLLLAGVGMGTAVGLGLTPGWATLARTHLLLAGWICVTILGAMTQFVPVWSGVRLHSRRLAARQLWLATAGLLGMVAALLSGSFVVLAPAGLLLAAGFWTFAYNVGRTLARARPLDVTERHFAIALGFFVLVPVLGIALAADLIVPLFRPLGVDRIGVVGAHATLAVFGAILTTVFGALYQLSTMFSQTELEAVDRHLQRFETATYPAGVLALAAGRLLDARILAVLGGLLVAACVGAVGVVLLRRCLKTHLDLGAMLSRYAVAGTAMVAWAGLTLPAWASDPLSPATRFGAPGTVHLLTFGVVGFVVLGTLYHVVPFLVWVERYSDRLGFEDVPAIDDLYSTRVARFDLVATVAGAALLTAGDLWGATAATALGGTATAVGIVAVAANLSLAIRRHAPRTLAEIFGALAGRGNDQGEAIPDGGEAVAGRDQEFASDP